MLPEPFAWINIPRGSITLINETDDNPAVYLPKNQPYTIHVPAFAIAKYPVTNAQYAHFIDAGGYTQAQWWTTAGWAQREQHAWTAPRFWHDPQFNGVNHPVVGVSWYEAVAFCRWLSDSSGEHITLPTESQWQRAAQGEGGTTYPWGNEWDSTRCNNTAERKWEEGGTVDVREYEGRDESEFGVVGMGGNVWEWCLTAYYTGRDNTEGMDMRVTRGGSWIAFLPQHFRCARRGKLLPHAVDSDGGFRLVRQKLYST